MSSFLPPCPVSAILAMLVVATFVLFVLRIVPGNLSAAISADTGGQEQVAALRAKLGLDTKAPLGEQSMPTSVR